MLRRTKDRILRLAMGANPRHAKFAARLLSCSKNASDCMGLVEVCHRYGLLFCPSSVCSTCISQAVVEDLPNSSDEARVARITVLAQLAKLVPDAFESRSDVITAFLLKHVLMVPISPNEVYFATLPVWPED